MRIFAAPSLLTLGAIVAAAAAAPPPATDLPVDGNALIRTWAAGGPAGSALLEITIARDGRVRLTRIVSATQEAFGWSAATAFSQWVFAAPSRGGHAVDGRVQVPVNFAAQAH